MIDPYLIACLLACLFAIEPICSLRDIELAKAMFVIAFVGKHPYSGTDIEPINRYVGAEDGCSDRYR